MCARLTLNGRSCFFLSCSRNVRLMRSYPVGKNKRERRLTTEHEGIEHNHTVSDRPSLCLSFTLSKALTLQRSPKQSMETPESPLTEFFLDTGEFVTDRASGETPRSSELLLVDERSISSL